MLPSTADRSDSRAAWLLRRSILLGALVLSCATHYQARAWAGGYTDKKISDDVYEVLFEANAYTNEETAQVYLLYRCAELTKANGFDHFVVLANEDNTSVTLAPNLNLQTKPAMSARIRMGRGPKPAGAGEAHVAAEVLQRLEPRINRR
jgi:hypothetical protein